jgi:hypothetical protein
VKLGQTRIVISPSPTPNALSMPVALRTDSQVVNVVTPSLPERWAFIASGMFAETSRASLTRPRCSGEVRCRTWRREGATRLRMTPLVNLGRWFDSERHSVTILVLSNIYAIIASRQGCFAGLALVSRRAVALSRAEGAT